MEAILVVIIGAICGVIINYLADVLPIYRKPGPPICSNCAKRFTVYNYLISFRCKNCGKRVSVRTLLVHICSILAAVIGLDISIPEFFILVVDSNNNIFRCDPGNRYRVSRCLIQTSVFGLILMFVAWPDQSRIYC